MLKMFSKALYQLIQKPIVTEKAISLMQFNQYVFKVSYKSNKVELAKAFEALFPGRKVTNVALLNKPGKMKRVGKRSVMKASYRKAIFTISGEPLDYFQELAHAN
jgi:large subunit ribosomal protein L23